MGYKFEKLIKFLKTCGFVSERTCYPEKTLIPIKVQGKIFHSYTKNFFHRNIFNKTPPSFQVHSKSINLEQKIRMRMRSNELI